MNVARPQPGTRLVVATATLALLASTASSGFAQDQESRWSRRAEATEFRPTIFHSTQAVNLPTAETLAAGELLFEIAHRFTPPFSDGWDALFGLDGPVRYRLGLSYALSDRAMLGLTRSNVDDNLDLTAKVRVVDGSDGAVPVALALAGGIGWNTQVDDRDDTASRNFQYYAQVVANARLGENVAVGVVPWVLRNPHILADEATTAAGVGLHGQVWLTEQLSLLAEWNVSEEDRASERVHDAGTFGIELETGGHFFKIVATNSTFLNPTQFLAGTFAPFEPDEWRLGFNITRVLAF